MVDNALGSLQILRASLDEDSDAALAESCRLAEQIAATPGASLADLAIHAELLVEVASGDSSIVSRLAEQILATARRLQGTP